MFSSDIWSEYRNHRFAPKTWNGRDKLRSRVCVLDDGNWHFFVPSIQTSVGKVFLVLSIFQKPEFMKKLEQNPTEIAVNITQIQFIFENQSTSRSGRWVHRSHFCQLETQGYTFSSVKKNQWIEKMKISIFRLCIFFKTEILACNRYATARETSKIRTRWISDILDFFLH